MLVPIAKAMLNKSNNCRETIALLLLTVSFGKLRTALGKRMNISIIWKKELKI